SVAGGTVDGLGLLAKGSSQVKAVVAVDQAYAGWALADQILRMATKAAPVNVLYPTRLFTAQNIGSIQVTTAAQSSGAWFGSTSYQAAFQKDWGRLPAFAWRGRDRVASGPATGSRLRRPADRRGVRSFRNMPPYVATRH